MGKIKYEIRSKIKGKLVPIYLNSISGINRIYRIAVFSGNGLVKALLKLDKAINENAISATLKNLGQSGARKLQMLLLSKNARWLRESGLESITLDADSTVKSVCGNQEGAGKGYNTTKRGAKSYHPLLVFVSEMKLLYHTLIQNLQILQLKRCDPYEIQIRMIYLLCND